MSSSIRGGRGPDLARLAASWGVDAGGATGGGWAALIHGGAGTLAPEDGRRHVDGCRAAADAAAGVLRSGGSALDAVERAVVLLEDDPCFNAGTGACLNAQGLVELDAALMEGAGLRAGAVCALPPFVHPIAIARAILDDGRHVLYAESGAARFAVEHGFTPTTSEAMTTASAREAWERHRAPHGPSAPAGEERVRPAGGGTVGAVAIDSRGNVAAATSTGGLAHKHGGRVGDSPLLGAGTYADNDGGACSATGLGEAIMRLGLAKTATDLLRARIHPEEAARAVVGQLGGRLAATGGVILVDRTGRLGLARNTAAMPWAAVGSELGEASGL